MAHNAHFLAFTAMMEGRKTVALDKTREVVASFPLEWVKQNAAFADAFQTAHWEAMKRFGLWEELLAQPAPPAELPYSTAYRHFLRGVAHAALGQFEAATQDREAFLSAREKVPAHFVVGTNTAADVLAIAGPYLDGELAYRSGDLAAAATLLAEAARLEDALKYDEPPDWTVPTRHTLGAILLEAGRFADAERAYREDLVRYPENGWALFGLEKALAGAGKSKDAEAVRARFEQAWNRSEIHLGASCLCVKGSTNRTLEP
jgi:tetratricopeptide (TPR) repeat protein